MLTLTPAGGGTFPRVLGHYVRDMGLLSLEEAVRRMTSLPAAWYGFAIAGRVTPGAIGSHYLRSRHGRRYSHIYIRRSRLLRIDLMCKQPHHLVSQGPYWRAAWAGALAGQQSCDHNGGT
jgi:hypothetical protein